jgi:hypothetical protein
LLLVMNRYRTEEPGAVGFAGEFFALTVDHYGTFCSATGDQENSATKDGAEHHAFSIALSGLSAMGFFSIGTNRQFIVWRERP